MLKIIRFVILAMAAIIALAVAGLVALPFIVSPDTIRQQVEQKLSASTGRLITITGPVDVHFFPTISVSFEGFSMSQTGDTAMKSPMLTIKKGEAELKPLPLLSGTAEFTNVNMTGVALYTMHKASKQNTLTLTCNMATHGYAHYDVAQGFTPEAIKRGVTSETKLDITDIVLMDKDLINQLSKNLGGSNWQQFESLSATITTQDGIVRSDDIKLVSSNINGMGAGTINLITEALSGEAKLNVSGITLPVYVKGTLSKPKYGIATGDAVNALFQGLGLTKGTSGGTSSSTSSDSSSQSTSKSSTGQKALDGLNSLFNKIGQ